MNLQVGDAHRVAGKLEDYANVLMDCSRVYGACEYCEVERTEENKQVLAFAEFLVTFGW
jgi:diphthamide synthase subunit DPH2